MGIYRVKIYGKIRAELEVTADGTILCTANGGQTSHFAVPPYDLVFAEQVSHDTVLLNFFHDGDADSLVQVSTTSENCASCSARSCLPCHRHHHRSNRKALQLLVTADRASAKGRDDKDPRLAPAWG